MWSSQQRNNATRLFLRRLGLLGLLLLVVLGAFGVWGVYQKERESAALRAQVEGDRADLAQRQMQLGGDIARLRTERGMEEALREQYALAERGEGLIVIVDSPASAPAEATPSVFDKIKQAFSWW